MSEIERLTLRIQALEGAFDKMMKIVHESHSDKAFEVELITQEHIAALEALGII